MSRRAEVRLQLGPRKYLFRLGLGELERVQDETGAGPFEVYARLAAAQLAIATGLHLFDGMLVAAGCKLGPKDAPQVVYNGLIGGGLAPDEALALTETWIVKRPLAEQVPVAHAVIMAAIIGVKDEPLGEGVGGAAKKTPRSRRFPTASSASARSTPKAP
jgi:hypothetical protein